MPIWVDENRFPIGGDWVHPDDPDFIQKEDRSLVHSFVGATKPLTAMIGTQSYTDTLYSSGTFSSNLTHVGVSIEHTSTFPMVSVFSGTMRSHLIFRFDTTSVWTVPLFPVPYEKTFSMMSATVPGSKSSFWKMHQFNPGVLPHLPGVYSDLLQYDVFSGHPTVSRESINFGDTDTTVFSKDDYETFKNVVNTDYYTTTITSGVDFCANDGEPPFITLHSPTASGMHLRPRDQIVDFSLGDAVAGVDLSTVYVSILGSALGEVMLVASGVDQTGGDVSITGNTLNYRFTYTPPALWEYNESVVVTISGADIQLSYPPLCTVSGQNNFVGDIPFQVLNITDISAEITAVGDTSAPYIQYEFPPSGTVGNNVFTDVTIPILDDLTGVDLSSIAVSIDGIPVVADGLPVTSETTLLASGVNYVVKHNPTTSFSYGSTVEVAVTAQDRALPTANVLTTSYDFTCIADSTLVIDNFKPDVGTHVDLANIDIVVDVTDDTYGINTDQTFFVINGTIVSGTQNVLASGVQLTYHPPNDFAFNEPVRVTVHGTNNNTAAPVVKEAFYTLFYGCRVLLVNQEPYSYADRVDVFVRARNNEQLHKDLSTGYFFTTYTQPQADIGASIEAINPESDLPATLNAIGPEHRYGETVTVEFSVEDFDGRLLGPYTYTYTIENK